MSNHSLSVTNLDGDSRKLLDLIGEIYEASLNTAHWDYVMQMISNVADSSSAALFIKDKRSGRAALVHSHGHSDMTIKLYNSIGYRFDPCGDRLEATEPCKAIMLFNPDEFKTKSDNIFQSLVAEKIGVKYVAGTMIQSNQETHVALALQRSREQGMFSPHALQTLELIAPHIERSLRINKVHEQLSSSQRALATGMEGLSTGVIVLGDNNKVIYRNSAASDICSIYSSLISLDEDTLELQRRKDSQRLQDTINKTKMIPDFSESIGFIETDTEEQDVSLVLTVMSPASLSNKEVTLFQTPINAVIYLVDLHSIDFKKMNAMMDIYGLTHAEAKVTVALANNISVNEVASIYGVKSNTIRSQLKSIFRKTNVRSQSELVRLVVGIASVN